MDIQFLVVIVGTSYWGFLNAVRTRAKRGHLIRSGEMRAAIANFYAGTREGECSASGMTSYE